MIFSATTNCRKFLLAIASSILLGLSAISARAADQTWEGGSAGNGTQWLSNTDWVGHVAYPGSLTGTTNTNIAIIPSNGTSASIGLNPSTGKFYLGAINFSSFTRTIYGSGNGDFTLTLNGANVNSVPNTILRNSGSGTMTLLRTGGAGIMTVALGNATDNIVNIDSTGGITIDAPITGASKKLTFNGNSTGVLTINGVIANTYSGITTVNVGELDLGKYPGVIAVAGNLQVGDDTGAANSAVTKLLAAGEIADTSDVTIKSDGQLNLNNFNATIDALNAASGSASIALGLGTLTVGGNNEASADYAGTISGGGGLTKLGTGTQTLSGSAANTYTGATTVNNGELDLNKTAGTNAIAGDANTATDDVTISGGTLKWLANDQVADDASISMTAGALNLNGASETIFGFTNSGGTFSTGANGHLIGTGNTVTWSGGSNTINDGGSVEDKHVVISGGTNTVNGGTNGGTLRVLSGGTGLEMTGATLTLDSNAAVGGKLLLEGDVTVNASATTATIASGGSAANAGTVDLNGANRTFTVAAGGAATDLLVSAQLANGGLTKAGAGTMSLTHANSYSGGTLINAGTLKALADARSAAAM